MNPIIHLITAFEYYEPQVYKKAEKFNELEAVLTEKITFSLQQSAVGKAVLNKLQARKEFIVYSPCS